MPISASVGRLFLLDFLLIIQIACLLVRSEASDLSARLRMAMIPIPHSLFMSHATTKQAMGLTCLTAWDSHGCSIFQCEVSEPLLSLYLQDDHQLGGEVPHVTECNYCTKCIVDHSPAPGSTSSSKNRRKLHDSSIHFSSGANPQRQIGERWLPKAADKVKFRIIQYV